MGSLKRKTITRPMPPGAELFTKEVDGNAIEFARWTIQRTAPDNARGRKRKGTIRTAEVITAADGSKRVRMQADTYTAKFRDADGLLVEVATGCRDKAAAQARLRELEQRAERVRRGVMRPEELETEDFQSVPMTQHVKEYLDELKGRGVNAVRIKTSGTYLTNDCEGCGFKYLRDLNADKLRKWLKRQPGISAAVYNWHSSLWVAFGWWLTGKRLNGKRVSLTGERRLTVNPFEGFGKLDQRADKRRTARALTVDEMRRLLDHAQRRPVADALTVRRGKNTGQPLAKLTDKRRAELEHVGMERALIYKTAILTGLRANELRTLHVADLSFGDVPFLVLRSANEKNRKGSTVPLRDDLATELREWVKGKPKGAEVFKVPAGLLRIMNRDLVAAGIDKIDERGRRVHLHALRHSTGTHLSTAGVSPRTAQAVMRHSDIALTMNTYTDEGLLDAAGAVQRLPHLPLSVAPDVAPTRGNHSRNSHKNTQSAGCDDTHTKTQKAQEKRGLNESGRCDSNTRPLRPERSALPG